ncbi:hypothetical protein MUK42_33861 [Musa troglodytarum]|uniref:Uncharacterized protein n=1 Tax=Musa troglodytarum TaxID=320322 RepID=A0A9E7K7U6_9LILI|nr:hypothetical protein MUK42_33861 [Musa troglodytarum]
MVKQTCTLPALSLLLRERERETGPQSILSCPHCLSHSSSRQRREETPSFGMFSFCVCSTFIYGGLALCFGNLGSCIIISGNKKNWVVSCLGDVKVTLIFLCTVMLGFFLCPNEKISAFLCRA